MPKPCRLTLLASCAFLSIALSLSAPHTLVTYRVAPHDTDPAIRRFDTPHYVVLDPSATQPVDLLVFLSGTGGTPENASDFLTLAASRGYRAVSLAYNDLPAVINVCPRDPDTGCSAKVRQKRIFGDDVTSVIDDTREESIVHRLVKLVVKLDRDHSSEGWHEYLEGDQPKWGRIAIAGHSQGAGMAAFIAQKKRVARVILFSSPWDFYGRQRELAPWIRTGPGATPSDAWFGAYHRKENTSDLIASAYKALKIPKDHIRVLTLEPGRMIGDNPYHLSVVGNRATPRDENGSPKYADDWAFLAGPGR